jgi:hypothetical protein
MRFELLPHQDDDLLFWRAIGGGFSFVIAGNMRDGYTASAMPLSGGVRYDLGGYCGCKTLEAAKEACWQFLRRRQN